MAAVNRGRFATTAGDDGIVVLLIGMRINRFWQVWKWGPVFTAMPRMLVELAKDPSLGLVGSPRVMVSGRVIQVQQYWRSFEALESYARGRDHEHLPAWRAFNRRVRDNGSVGIFHETYVVGAGQSEALYVNMPPYGLGAAIAARPTAEVGETAAARIAGGAIPAAPSAGD